MALRLPPRAYGGVQLESFLAVLDVLPVLDASGGQRGEHGAQGGASDGYGAGEAKLRPSGPGQLVDAPAVLGRGRET